MLPEARRSDRGTCSRGVVRRSHRAPVGCQQLLGGTGEETDHPLRVKQYSIQLQYKKARTMLIVIAPYPLTVQGGLNNIKSRVNMMAGMAWNPLLNGFKVRHTVHSHRGHRGISKGARHWPRTSREERVGPAREEQLDSCRWRKDPSTRC
jgi:hypothetical protein